jgi:glycerate-2-kinase
MPDNNGSHGFPVLPGGPMMGGPTRTNVNDFRAILIL